MAKTSPGKAMTPIKNQVNGRGGLKDLKRKVKKADQREHSRKMKAKKENQVRPQTFTEG